MDKVNKQELRRLAEYVDQFRKGDKPDVEKFCQYTELFSAKGILSLLDECDGLMAQHSRDSAELRSLCQARDEARRERDQLRAELEQYRKDAERYRWLCDQPGFQLWLDGVLRDEEINSTGLDVDIDIDALMAKEGGANG